MGQESEYKTIPRILKVPPPFFSTTFTKLLPRALQSMGRRPFSPGFAFTCPCDTETGTHKMAGVLCLTTNLMGAGGEGGEGEGAQIQPK